VSDAPPPPPPGGVYQPGGGYGRPLPYTELAGPRVLQYLLDALISFGLSLIGLVAFIPAAVAQSAPLLVVGFVVFLAGSYLASAWVEVFHAYHRGGQTYGMTALDLRVVDEATLGEPTLRQLVLRWLMLLLVDGGVIALVLILVTDKHQRVGDMLAKTLVVRTDDPLVAAVRAARPPGTAR
jgi:uncharacterized RDD family membrane protein YckC